VHDGKLNLVAETEVKGAVYALEAFNGKVLAGINSKVSLYRWVENGDGSFDLKLVCDHTGHVLALYLASRGDFFIVGDLMKSITLLVYKPVDERIDEIARDYSPHWMTAAEIADADNYIGAENSYNLITVRKNLEATTDEDRARLEPGGCFHVGEFVNRFRHGSLVMKAPESEVGSMRLPTILYGTVSGAIGILASIPKELYDSLVLVQAQLLKTIKGVGGFDVRFSSFFIFVSTISFPPRVLTED
jgi:DNA damage-binding protein 1